MPAESTYPNAPTKSLFGWNGFLLRTFGLVLLVHLVIFILYRSSMKVFDGSPENQQPLTSLSLPSLRGDVRLARLSEVVTNNPCEFYPDKSCPQDVSDSEAVANLRKQQLAPATHQLIENFRYHSAYDIARHLLVDGQEQEARSLLSNNVFEKGDYAVIYKANFANKWFLVPAASYVAHHREYDALTLFENYIDIMRVPVLNHRWLSQPGLDSTDIPPISDIFCANTDRLSHDQCLIGLLKVVASQIAAFMPDSEGIIDFTDDRSVQPNLYQIYASIPTSFKTDQLKDYFQVWAWDGRTAPEPEHGQLSKDESVAWNYAFAIRLLGSATKDANCTSNVVRSRQLLSSVAEDGDSLGYFAVPAAHRNV
jgi:hypothetical protein